MVKSTDKSNVNEYEDSSSEDVSSSIACLSTFAASYDQLMEKLVTYRQVRMLAFKRLKRCCASIPLTRETITGKLSQDLQSIFLSNLESLAKEDIVEVIQLIYSKVCVINASAGCEKRT